VAGGVGGGGREFGLGDDLAYRDGALTEARPTFIAPVGPAYAQIHAGALAGGGDPVDTGSAFYRLYASDGSHPSPPGTLLSAYVVATSLTGVSPQGLPAPEGMDADDVALLQAAAVETVFDDGLGYTYPSRRAAPGGPALRIA
jgi:hypothetical protein